MAKINTALIEGYDKMSPEEKLKALEAFEMADPDYSGYVKKDVFDKTASELASAKKQIREKMTDDERKEKEASEKWDELQSKYDALVRKDAISENKVRLLSLGYEEALASETAEAMANGELDKVFAAQKKHLDSLERKIRADVLKDTPKPGKDTVPGAADYQKKIEEARQSGDLSAAAYYTRLAAQAETQTK